MQTFPAAKKTAGQQRDLSSTAATVSSGGEGERLSGVPSYFTLLRFPFCLRAARQVALL